MSEQSGEAISARRRTGLAYVSDVPYPAMYNAELAPAALDFVGRLAGREPPGHKPGFNWCELGCGPGLTAVLLAGLHPDGDFHGVDALSGHVADGRILAAEAGLRNLHLHATDFGGALSLDLPQFDYIVAHGVYSWIDERNRAKMLDFIDRRLKPGGLVYVSYNNMVGWAIDAPYQYLVRHLADHHAGDSTARCLAAMEDVDRLAAAGAASLRGSPIVQYLNDHRARFETNYFPHEYLQPAWRPAYVTDVRRDLATIGLDAVGSAIVVNNFDSFVLRASEREALAWFAAPDQRELVRDYCLASRFRKDVFGRALPRLDSAAQTRALMAMRFDLARLPSEIDYRLTTSASEIGFDSPAARTLVTALIQGPSSLDALYAAAIPPSNLLAAALTLTAAQAIQPVADRGFDIDELNQALLSRLEGPSPIRYLALSTGATLKGDLDALRAWRDRKPSLDQAEWMTFVERRLKYSKVN